MKKSIILLSILFFVAASIIFLPDFFTRPIDNATSKQTSPSKNAKASNIIKETDIAATPSRNDTNKIVVKNNPNRAGNTAINTDFNNVLTKQKIQYRRHNEYFKNQRNIFALNNRSEEQKAIDALQFNPYWGLEADYANLTTTHKGQEAALDNASEVRFRDSAESSAILINIIGSIPLTDKSSFFAKVGVNNWEIEENRANALSANQRPDYGQPGISADLDGGTDMFYGIGFKYDYDSFILKSEMQVFEINGEEHEIFTIGGDFKF